MDCLLLIVSEILAGISEITPGGFGPNYAQNLWKSQAESFLSTFFSIARWEPYTALKLLTIVFSAAWNDVRHHPPTNHLASVQTFATCGERDDLTY
jgi:hypothetical protein